MGRAAVNFAARPVHCAGSLSAAAPRTQLGSNNGASISLLFCKMQSPGIGPRGNIHDARKAMLPVNRKFGTCHSAGISMAAWVARQKANLKAAAIVRSVLGR